MLLQWQTLDVVFGNGENDREASYSNKVKMNWVVRKCQSTECNLDGGRERLHPLALKNRVQKKVFKNRGWGKERLF
ncbi:unnamed protein product [Camellia sinensis]